MDWRLEPYERRMEKNQIVKPSLIAGRINVIMSVILIRLSMFGGVPD